jgi:protein O-GlcNAc transferase
VSDSTNAERLAAGRAAHGEGRLDDARRRYQAVLADDPLNPEALDLVGLLHLQAADLPRASTHLARALAVAPSSVEALNHFALVLLRTGQHVPALRVLVRALAVRTDFAEVHLNCGGILFELAEWEQAIGCYDRALTLRPDYADAHANRASALQLLGRVDEPGPGYRRALALRPEFPEAHNSLAVLHQAVGRLDEAIRGFRRALAVDPRQSSIHSNLLFCFTYAENIDEDAIYRAFREWEARHARPLYAEARPHGNTPDPDRRLRIGYLSADLRDHPVGYNLIASLERHDRRQIELTLYALVRSDDETCRRFQRTADRWRWVAGFDERQIAEQVRDDEIDVLVLVAPHTAGHRPLVAALKPAPVQVALYDLTTTGMTAVDAWLTDPMFHPPGTNERFVEQLLALPCLVNHDLPSPSPPVGAPPSLTTGHVTFGSLNNPAKMTSGVIALWADVLRRTPGSRLLLKYLDRYASAALQESVYTRFAAHGIGPERLDLRAGRLSRAAQLRLLDEVDVALDPFPFNGCTTTFEALWMGVPVVALEGSRFLGRMSTGFLRHAGLGELVASDRHDYAERASALGSDLARRIALRRRLRDLLLGSPLCDAQSHADSLVTAYRSLWRRWCATGTMPVVGPAAPV